MRRGILTTELVLDHEGHSFLNASHELTAVDIFHKGVHVVDGEDVVEDGILLLFEDTRGIVRHRADDSVSMLVFGSLTTHHLLVILVAHAGVYDERTFGASAAMKVDLDPHALGTGLACLLDDLLELGEVDVENGLEVQILQLLRGFRLHKRIDDGRVLAGVRVGVLQSKLDLALALKPLYENRKVRRCGRVDRLLHMLAINAEGELVAVLIVHLDVVEFQTCGKKACRGLVRTIDHKVVCGILQLHLEDDTLHDGTHGIHDASKRGRVLEENGPRRGRETLLLLEQ